MLVGGVMVNALAFSGSNYLFSMLRSSDFNEERKRHDQAVEQLQARAGKMVSKTDWASRLDKWGPPSSGARRPDHVRCRRRNTRGSSEQNLTPYDLSPRCQNSTCRAVAKETVRSPSLYWGWPRPAWWPTNSLKIKKRYVADRPASPIYYMHFFFFGPTNPLLLVAKQHNTTKLDRLLAPWLPHVGGLSGC